MELKLNDLLSLPNQPSLTVLVSNSSSSSSNINISSSSSSNNATANAEQTSPSPSTPPPTTISTSLNSLLNSLQSNAAAQPAAALTDSSKFSFCQSDSLVHTLLSLLSKRDLINEQSSKYLIQYFQFFNYYLSLGMQQVSLSFES
jgi:hypothetical protein